MIHQELIWEFPVLNKYRNDPIVTMIEQTLNFRFMFISTSGIAK